jgi:hypothetical protein
MAPEGEFSVPFEELDPSSFEVCLICGRLRGGASREHRCTCQPRTPDWERLWAGRDMRSDLDLCALCVRGTVTTWSRWSWLACDTCREVSRQVGEWYGRRGALPLGRHSVMNGDVLQPAGVSDADVRAVAGSLTASARRATSLWEWRLAEFDRLAGPLRTTGPMLSLTEWQRRRSPSLGASVDAFDRYGVVPVPAELSDLGAAQRAFLSSTA